jgi:hypothetical protein
MCLNFEFKEDKIEHNIYSASASYGLTGVRCELVTFCSSEKLLNESELC